VEALLDPGIALTQLLAGLSKGMLFFLLAAGLTLVLGVQGILNFAHGALFMVGAYLTITTANIVGAQFGFWVALVVVPLGLALIGVLVERLLLRRIYGAEVVMQILLLYGLTLILSDGVRMIWGSGFHTMQRPAMLSGAIRLGPVRLAEYNLLLLILGPLVALGLWFLLYRTSFGRTVRAVSADREMAESLGHNVQRYFTGVFALGAALAGLSGVLFTGAGSINPTLDASILVTVFVVVVIGGLGSFGGAILAGLIVGVVEAFGIMLFPGLAVVSMFLVMAVVLIVRPWGLFGSPLGPLTE
jgi:branched-chain amino acid transport system permease protein